MPIKIGDIWLLDGFIIADMTKIDDVQIILGRAFMATIGCYIDLRRGQITFEVHGCYAMFCHMEEKAVSPNSSLLDEFPLSPEADM